MSIDFNSKPEMRLIAVVTGANKGIGLEIVRQLAHQGIKVILTARDEKRGIAAAASLQDEAASCQLDVVFHQLDVCDPHSVASLAQFIQTEFGRLDILVNNAAVTGHVVDMESLKALNIDYASWLSGEAVHLAKGAIKQTHVEAGACIDTNYYGCKRVTEALIPLLQKSMAGARIVNVSSLRGQLKWIGNEKIRNELANVDSLTEGRLDSLLQQFLDDLKHGTVEENGWPVMESAYSVSKAAMNAYTRIIAKTQPNVCMNCVNPGFVATDMTFHAGTLTVEEGAKGPVMLALLPAGGSSGCHFDGTKIAEF